MREERFLSGVSSCFISLSHFFPDYIKVILIRASLAGEHPNFIVPVKKVRPLQLKPEAVRLTIRPANHYGTLKTARY